MRKRDNDDDVENLSGSYMYGVCYNNKRISNLVGTYLLMTCKKNTLKMSVIVSNFFRIKVKSAT